MQSRKDLTPSPLHDPFTSVSLKSSLQGCHRLLVVSFFLSFTFTFAFTPLFIFLVLFTLLTFFTL